jgi:hypothetical protein
MPEVVVNTMVAGPAAVDDFVLGRPDRFYPGQPKQELAFRDTHELEDHRQLIIGH